MCGPTSTLVLQNLKIIPGKDIVVEEGYDHGIKTYKISATTEDIEEELADHEARIRQEVIDREEGDARLEELIKNHPSYLVVGTDAQGLPDVEEPSEVYLYLTEIIGTRLDNYREWIWQGEWICIGETSVDPYSADETKGMHLDENRVFSIKLGDEPVDVEETTVSGLGFDDNGNLYNTSRECTEDEMEDWLAYDYLVPDPASLNGSDNEYEDDNG